MEKTLLEQLQDYKLKGIFEQFWKDFEKEIIENYLINDAKTGLYYQRPSSKV